MDLLEIFSDSTDLVNYPAHSVIFEEGGEAEFMYVVMEGRFISLCTGLQ
jgi:CRP-like cAMP-binding protein